MSKSGVCLSERVNLFDFVDFNFENFPNLTQPQFFFNFLVCPNLWIRSLMSFTHMSLSKLGVCHVRTYFLSMPESGVCYAYVDTQF